MSDVRQPLHSTAFHSKDTKMKLVAVFALLFVIAVSSIHGEENDDLVGDKIPASAVLEAVRGAIKDGAEFIAVDDVVITVDDSDKPDVNPLFRKLFKRCHSGECRKKCNAKGQNGACVWFKCVCWK